MKKSSYLGLFLVSLFLLNNLYAQVEPPTCKEKLKTALDYLERDLEYSEALKNEIYASIEPCFDNTTIEEKYRIAILILKGHFPKKGEKEAFTLLEEVVAQGYQKANYDLGVLYKEGRGCDIDFDKAMSCFRKAAKQNHEKAAYSIGYLYLKGLGTIEQNYKQAIAWFKQSDYPMAKHWLAVCYFYGYGVAQDQNRAISYLSESTIVNSKTLIDQFETEKTNTLSAGGRTTSESSQNIRANKTVELPEESFNYFSLNEETIFDHWTGKIIQYDWSGKHIKRTLPIRLSIEEDGENSSYKFEINEQEIKGEAAYYDNEVSFQDLTISLERLLADHPKQKNITYTIVSANLKEIEYQGIRYLKGQLETFIPEWKEPGMPMDIILAKESTISEEAIEALAGQDKSFIKLYPVPFQKDILIQYELEHPATVEVVIQDYTGTQNKSIAARSAKNAGKHLHHFDSTGLPKGIYIVKVLVNGEAHTRIVIKK